MTKRLLNSLKQENGNNEKIDDNNKSIMEILQLDNIKLLCEKNALREENYDEVHHYSKKNMIK